MENYRIWGRIMRHQRIVAQAVVPIGEAGMEDAFETLCHGLDIQRPIQLPKHDRDWARFGRTFYTQEHFTESIPFDRLEIELLTPDGEKHSSVRRTPLMDA